MFCSPSGGDKLSPSAGKSKRILDRLKFRIHVSTRVGISHQDSFWSYSSKTPGIALLSLYLLRRKHYFNA